MPDRQTNPAAPSQACPLAPAHGTDRKLAHLSSGVYPATPAHGSTLADDAFRRRQITLPAAGAL